jgi:hypothetical protein
MQAVSNQIRGNIQHFASVKDHGESARDRDSYQGAQHDEYSAPRDSHGIVRNYGIEQKIHNRNNDSNNGCRCILFKE